MQLAFVLYKYFPFGGLQRDFMRIAQECQARGHAIRVYTPIWEGEVPDGFEVVVVPVKALFNHHRNEKLTAWIAADLAKRPVDRVIGFNKMPGLDVYNAADGCFEDKAQNLRHSLYRRWGRYRTANTALTVAVVVELAGFGLAPAVLMACGFFLGAAGQVVKLSADIAMQLDVDDALRGHVFAVQDSLFWTAFVVAVTASAAFMPADEHAPGLIVAAAAIYLAGLAGHALSAPRTR